VTDVFFQSIFSQSRFYIDRANVNPFVESSVLTPFFTTQLENNIPTQFINEAQTKQIGAVFVEEVNRREINDLLSLLDKKIVLKGKRAELGIPYPNSNEIKNIIIIGSQNPIDNNHGSAHENDIAEDNRFLKVPFPNAIGESGSSQLAFMNSKSVYDTFWEEYQQRLNLDEEASWQELYISATDLSNFTFDLSPSHREFLDLMLAYIETNPKSAIERNQALINASNLDLRFFVREDEAYQMVNEVQSSLKYPIVRRDLNKIINFAKLVAFIRSIKQKDFNPQISLIDIISSFGVLLAGRKVNSLEINLFDYVNDAFRSYEKLQAKYKAKESQSIREKIFEKALNNYLNSGKTLDIFQKTLRDLAIKHGSNQFPSPSMSVFNSKLIADIMVLEHFSSQYSEIFLEAINASTPRSALNQMYLKHLSSLPSIYVHRLHWLVETFEV
jgi:hypothetical protein